MQFNKHQLKCPALPVELKNFENYFHLENNLFLGYVTPRVSMGFIKKYSQIASYVWPAIVNIQI